MSKRRRLVAFRSLRSAPNRETGFSLIEVLVALGILAAVAVVFLVGMSVSSKAVMVSQQAVAVDSLAKSQMEYVKSLPYDDTSVPRPVYGVDPSLTIPQGYNIAVAAQRLKLKDDGTDGGLQQITVTVTHDEKVFTLVGYKVNRIQ
jgi:prepilin-type N-terminal cleavage/methylation domain-containing protein